jgi:hypothetical protein
VKGQGAHIVLTREDAKTVFSAADDEAVRKTVTALRNSKKHRDAKLVLETGTSWDAIHRCLTEGTLDPEAGEFPLNHTILGGKRIHKAGDFEAIMVRPDIVPYIAEQLHHVKRDVIHSAYQKIDPADYGQPLTITDFDKIWNSLQQIRQLYEDAATERCAVLFTVDRGVIAPSK